MSLGAQTKTPALWDYGNGYLRIVDRRDSGQNVALHELQGGTDTGAAMTELVLGAILLASGRCVSAADDSGGSSVAAIFFNFGDANS